jgi:hypothetical protein
MRRKIGKGNEKPLARGAFGRERRTARQNVPYREGLVWILAVILVLADMKAMIACSAFFDNMPKI